MPVGSNIQIDKLAGNQIGELHKAAEANGHGLLFPNRIITKNEEIVGYLSMLGMPVVNVWLDTKKTGPKDTVIMLKYVERYMRDKQITHYIFPCTKTSPYFPLMQKHIGRDLGEFNLFEKVL